MRSIWQQSELSVILVLPPGQWKQVPLLPANSARMVTSYLEGPQAAWATQYGVPPGPGALLFDATGQAVWRHEGLLDAAELPRLTEAFDQHLHPASRIDWYAPRLRATEGQAAPEFFFEYTPGYTISLKRLKGFKVLVNFWNGRAATPCLTELRRLQHIHEQSEKLGVVVLTVYDGDAQRAAELCKQEGLSLRVIADPRRKICDDYGVTCYPTTISIDEHGRICAIQFGAVDLLEDKLEQT
jgi:peroxiredoxin